MFRECERRRRGADAQRRALRDQSAAALEHEGEALGGVLRTVQSASGLGAPAIAGPPSSRRGEELPLVAVEQVAAEGRGLEPEAGGVAQPDLPEAEAVAPALEVGAGLRAEHVAAAGHRVPVLRGLEPRRAERDGGELGVRQGALGGDVVGRGPRLDGGRGVGHLGAGLAAAGEEVVVLRVVRVQRRAGRVDVRQAGGGLERLVVLAQRQGAAAGRRRQGQRDPDHREREDAGTGESGVAAPRSGAAFDHHCVLPCVSADAGCPWTHSRGRKRLRPPSQGDDGRTYGGASRVSSACGR